MLEDGSSLADQSIENGDVLGVAYQSAGTLERTLYHSSCCDMVAASEKMASPIAYWQPSQMKITRQWQTAMYV